MNTSVTGAVPLTRVENRVEQRTGQKTVEVQKTGERQVRYDKREAILLDIARLVWKHDVTIAELYTMLGADLEGGKLECDQEVAMLAGILTGWKHRPEG